MPFGNSLGEFVFKVQSVRQSDCGIYPKTQAFYARRHNMTRSTLGCTPRCYKAAKFSVATRSGWND
jgi:hypothetical protein